MMNVATIFFPKRQKRDKQKKRFLRVFYVSILIVYTNIRESSFLQRDFLEKK